MKTCRTKILICLAACILSGVLVCRSNEKKSEAAKPVDTLTAATSHYEPGKFVLPPEAGEYKVLGVLDGLKKYVVQYDHRLIRGGDPYSEEAAATLKNLQVKTIVSITPTDREREFCAANGFALVEIPFRYTVGPGKFDIVRFLQTVRSAGGPVYLHCHGGTHRGGALGVAYRVHELGWSFERALIEHGRLGGDLKANHAMLEAVRAFKPE